MKSNAYLNGQDILNWYKTSMKIHLGQYLYPIQRTGGRQNKLNPVEMFPEVV